MSPSSIGLATTNASLEFASMKAVRTQVSSSPAVNATRHAQPLSSTAVALTSPAPASATADYGDLIRKARHGDDAGAARISPSWIVGEVAGEDASAVEEAKALTSSFIGSAAGLQAMGRTQLGHRADVATALDTLASAAAKDAQDEPLPTRDGTAADAAQAPAATQVNARRGAQRGGKDDAALGGLKPLIDESGNRRFWTGSGYETVNSDGINLLLLKKMVDSQSLLEQIEAEQAADKGLLKSEPVAPATVDRSGLGASRSRPDLAASGSGVTQYLSSSSQRIDTKV